MADAYDARDRPAVRTAYLGVLRSAGPFNDALDDRMYRRFGGDADLGRKINLDDAVFPAEALARGARDQMAVRAVGLDSAWIAFLDSLQDDYARTLRRTLDASADDCDRF